MNERIIKAMFILLSTVWVGFANAETWSNWTEWKKMNNHPGLQYQVRCKDTYDDGSPFRVFEGDSVDAVWELRFFNGYSEKIRFSAMLAPYEHNDQKDDDYAYSPKTLLPNEYSLVHTAIVRNRRCNQGYSLWYKDFIKEGGQSDTQGIDIQGTSSWRRSSRYITIDTQKIVNNGSQTTGRLKVTVWATTSPYSGGALNGYRVGYYYLGELKPNYYYENLSQRTSYYKPRRRGNYYTVLTVEEETASGWLIRDYVNFDGTARF